MAVNCGAMSESLLESELFGHERGAFTGAIQARKGLFRSADGGTVFLDEVGDMPVSLQVKLLRAIQEHEVTPVGASYPIRFDARIVAATNRDLEADVRNGLFREDLFYRLNVIEINVPPLRERRSDIPALARHFAMRTARMQDQPLKEISQEAMALLMDHDWPGNVRELENCIERAFLLAEDTIEAEDLPAKILDRNAINRSVSQKSEDGILPLDEIERRHIHEVLSQMENDKVKASKALGIDLSTLYRKLKRFELTDRED
ncbi:sigma-54 dependent transcriptional regulator [Leptolyngbya sp. 7M]|nr:sigma-54 dependent transcriptional regulator [Leptolyngbya sp. 7M]